MKQMIKKIFLVILLSALTIPLFSQDNKILADKEIDSLVTKLLNHANEDYEKGEIESSYKQVNNALRILKNPEKALNVIYIARVVYQQKLENLIQKYNEDDFIDVKVNLQNYPFIQNDKIQTLVTQIENKTAKKQNRETYHFYIIFIIIVCLILFIVIAAIIFINRSLKLTSKQNREYINAVKMLAANQTQTNRLMIGGMTELYGSNLKIAGSSTWDPTKALPDVEISEEDMEELKQLAMKCEEIGSKIDKISGRKNNSKNVSEFVYKLSIQMGLPQGMAMLNFCAAMVYDAGFLGMDPILLTSENLNKEQKEALKNHVFLTEKYLDFVPKKYWSVFEDAATKHHENIDGTGYPKGLKGKSIPQIARLIRVAESYVSLSSKRNYRQALDKETSIQMMKDKPGIYDEEVVAALDFIL